MRLLLLTTLAAAAGAAAASAQPVFHPGILIATDVLPSSQDLDGCMDTARLVFSGTGLVIESNGTSYYGSNEERTITIRCDVPGKVVFVEGFFPDDKDKLDPIEAAFAHRAAAPLVASLAKAHRIAVDCSRQASCRMDAPAVCRQAYARSVKPTATVVLEDKCSDGQGSYTCKITYELDCN
ncbi:MAG TPA: hypothetical protein VL460_05600 [Caulobacteraceae bacterium]|jgi:hypothetical protein|nr:hypothetical protein [Caulobacteraceae bacterium]